MANSYTRKSQNSCLCTYSSFAVRLFSTDSSLRVCFKASLHSKNLTSVKHKLLIYIKKQRIQSRCSLFGFKMLDRFTTTGQRVWGSVLILGSWRIGPQETAWMKNLDNSLRNFSLLQSYYQLQSPYYWRYTNISNKHANDLLEKGLA